MTRQSTDLLAIHSVGIESTWLVEDFEENIAALVQHVNADL